jgi:hypothetical protein
VWLVPYNWKAAAFCVILAFPITSNLAAGDVVPIPKLPPLALIYESLFADIREFKVALLYKSNAPPLVEFSYNNAGKLDVEVARSNNPPRLFVADDLISNLAPGDVAPIPKLPLLSKVILWLRVATEPILGN